MGFCNCSKFCCALLCVHSSFAIISMGKRELVALLSLSSWRLVIVVWLVLTMSRVRLQFAIVIFPYHNHLLFWTVSFKLSCLTFPGNLISILQNNALLSTEKSTVKPV